MSVEHRDVVDHDLDPHLVIGKATIPVVHGDREVVRPDRDAIIILDSNQVVLSAIQAETISQPFAVLKDAGEASAARQLL